MQLETSAFVHSFWQFSRSMKRTAVGRCWGEEEEEEECRRRRLLRLVWCGNRRRSIGFVDPAQIRQINGRTTARPPQRNAC